jgi:Bcr/CflA subfamily drug resistance transporter
MWFIFVICMIAGCLTSFAADIYAPSLPGIAENLHAQIEQVQFSMAVYLFGVALAQLIFGPLSEGLGRKGPWIMGTVIMFIGSLICYLAPTIEVLIAGRFIQGIGAGSSAVLWRVVFRDLFNKEQLAKMGSYGVIFVMFILPAAPALGGFLDSTYNWRASFLFMLGYTGIVLLLLLFGYKETSKHHQRERLKLSYVGNMFLLMLTNRVFMGIAMSTFLTYGSFFSWFVVGPVLLIEGVGISSEEFGQLMCLWVGLAFLAGGFLNGRLVTRWGIPAMMRLGWALQIVAGALLFAGKMWMGLTLWSVLLPIMMLFFGCTFIWPNANATAFAPFGHIAGYAGALYGFFQMAGGAVMGSLLAFLPHESQLPLALAILTSSALAWIVYEKVVQAEAKNALPS